jgi:hypothetical protein
MAGKRKEVCNHLVIAFQMLGGEAVCTVEEDGS